jgi:predicted YcjX-like family ATPase
MTDNATTPAPVALTLAETKPGEVPRLALRPRDAAKALGFCERKLWELTKRGEIPHVRLDRAILYIVDDLREFLVKRRIGGGT